MNKAWIFFLVFGYAASFFILIVKLEEKKAERIYWRRNVALLEEC